MSHLKIFYNIRAYEKNCELIEEKVFFVAKTAAAAYSSIFLPQERINLIPARIFYHNEIFCYLDTLYHTKKEEDENMPCGGCVRNKKNIW